MSFVIEEWNPFIKPWLVPQVSMSKVVRWKDHLENDKSKSLRIQNTLQHTHSLLFFCDVFLSKLSKYIDLDEKLLLRCCYYHDVGEGICGENSGFDVCFDLKNDDHDLNEYLAFCALHSGLDNDFLFKIKQAFLLQFAGRDKSLEIFPPDAVDIMLTLRKYKPYEVLFFDALEKSEYFIYALEHSADGNHMDLLRSVVKNQSARLDELAQKLPGFKEEIWTDAVSAKFKSLL